MNLTVFIIKHSWVYRYPRKPFAVALALRLHSVAGTSHWVLLFAFQVQQVQTVQQVQHVYPAQVQYVEGSDTVYTNGAM